MNSADCQLPIGEFVSRLLRSNGFIMLPAASIRVERQLIQMPFSPNFPADSLNSL